MNDDKTALDELKLRILSSFKFHAMQGFSTFQMTDKQLDEWVDEELLRIIAKREQAARKDELSWFRGYYHKEMSETVWNYLNQRIAELSPNQTAEGEN